MKKLTDRYKRWLLHRCRYQSSRPASRQREKKSIVWAWTGEQVIQAFVRHGATEPPRTLCLNSNARETLDFFNEWRMRSVIGKGAPLPKKLDWFIPASRPGGIKGISRYLDLAKVEHLSTAAAVIMAADYERLAHFVGSAPPTINLDTWSSPLFRKLFELGFFEIVGLSERVSERYVDGGKVRTMKILSGRDASENREAGRRLLELADFLTEGIGLSEDVVLALNTALSEAMINVARHAYPDDLDPEKHLHIGKWWVTGEADRRRRTLTVVIYDQGATIPVTLPKKAPMEAIQSYFASVGASVARFAGIRISEDTEYSDDSAYIAYAMDVGSTQTGEDFHGLGIPQMKELVQICGKGQLSIFSRGGRCVFDHSGKTTRSTYPCSIGGTLIEWVIELP